MDLSRISTLANRQWSTNRFDKWAEDLHAVCGRFQPKPVEPGKQVRGGVSRKELSGLVFAHVVNDLDRIVRSPSDIRRDDKGDLLLLIQVEGQCGVEQRDVRFMLAAGDCTLLDSAVPLAFNFGGTLSNHVSLHLPRQAILAAQPMGLGGPRKLDGYDPMAVVLRALFAKLLTMPSEPEAQPLIGLLNDAIRQSLIDAVPKGGVVEAAEIRLQRARFLIEQNLTIPELGVTWLADRLGVSIRTLQEDFRISGQSCTEVIRECRLRRVHDRLRRYGLRQGETIASIALSAGFNDISYFNRSFRSMFGGTPGDFLRPN
ncbi:helix-turn-helix domain-containing protein [Acidocella aminolytica]|uniref:Transcriptional regulator AraC n=1 Tax=Acidocella aminolytica 101 = DSM 11237 TaxID=1120923 RepID=A0A0D6PGM0_9PROT|nr:helix-turn-helix domain-containing protein [Acidocella aminolytica]GAN80920.1 transcriptional regulator AraC [Acidocella aminolytica 101 = DSM 11237]GBQ35415.1 AraC family transcriptional regulator [Acidocella aminolytica 101 = DSM 11237]